MINITSVPRVTSNIHDQHSVDTHFESRNELAEKIASIHEFKKSTGNKSKSGESFETKETKHQSYI